MRQRPHSSNAPLTMAERMRVDAELADMIASGEGRLSRHDIALLSEALHRYADEIEAWQARAAEAAYRTRRAA